MGKKVNRQVAARMLLAAQEMVESAAALVPYDDENEFGGSMRDQVVEKANEIRLLAGDVAGGQRG